MRIETVRKVTSVAAVAGVSLLVAGLLLGQETARSSASSKNPTTSTISDTHFSKSTSQTFFHRTVGRGGFADLNGLGGFMGALGH